MASSSDTTEGQLAEQPEAEHETEEQEEIRDEDFFVDENLEMEDGMDDAGAPQEFEQLQDLDDILEITEPQGEMEVLLKNKEEKAQD